MSDEQVPAAAVAAFKAAHPAAREVKWEKEAGNYEASFQQEQGETSLVFLPTGQLLETETEIPVGQLPEAVRAKLARQYGGYKVTEAAKIVAAATGAATYEAEVQNGPEEMDLVFDGDGQLVKKEVGDKEDGKE